MRTAVLIALVGVAAWAWCGCDARPQGDGGYGKQPEGYFQYVNVPAHKEYEFGWNRGNPHHYISRFEQAKDHRFRTRVKWADTYDGYGEHYWEYNHAPKYPDHHKDSYKAPEPSYGPPKAQGYPSEHLPIVVDPIDIQDVNIHHFSQPRESGVQRSY
ncbi:hypothetical protein Pcinc_009606 [Petrolisthes cinctipes]|uniref:Uncharacterized protein n=1 Tax=Petrolisthes cinctipes TaxID=88211 RepID=A0AAE1KW99_PETCI|nr:hypothetical protein Pcinc_024560 [Petrolisthes cinctipes]KAK3886222.1 hypothetical protein Pcinc_009606 [Petrolisthes cinctipes]